MSSYRETIFSEESSFKETHFKRETLFEHTRFLGTANFGDSRFTQVEFADTTFHELAYFRSAHFYKSLDIHSTDFKGYIDFRKAIIDNLHFGNDRKVMVIPGNLDLRDAFLTQAEFQDLIFLADVDFLKTTFKNEITFDSVSFKGTTNFTGAKFDGAALSLEDTNYSNLLITMKQVPYPKSWQVGEISGPFSRQQLLLEVFKKLEDQFRLHNQIEDANEAYFQSMVAQRKAAPSLWTSLWMFPLEKCCGYGAKFWWVVGWSLPACFIFALIHYKMGNFVDLAQEKIDEDSIFRPKVLILPEQYLSSDKPKNQNRLARFKAAFMISTLLMYKMGRRKMQVSTRDSKRPRIIIFFVWLEWGIGYACVVAMAITAKNTLPFISTILAVF